MQSLTGKGQARQLLLLKRSHSGVQAHAVHAAQGVLKVAPGSAQNKPKPNWSMNKESLLACCGTGSDSPRSTGCAATAAASGATRTAALSLDARSESSGRVAACGACGAGEPPVACCRGDGSGAAAAAAGGGGAAAAAAAAAEATTACSSAGCGEPCAAPDGRLASLRGRGGRPAKADTETLEALRPRRERDRCGCCAGAGEACGGEPGTAARASTSWAAEGRWVGSGCMHASTRAATSGGQSAGQTSGRMRPRAGSRPVAISQSTMPRLAWGRVAVRAGHGSPALQSLRAPSAAADLNLRAQLAPTPQLAPHL